MISNTSEASDRHSCVFNFFNPSSGKWIGNLPIHLPTSTSSINCEVSSDMIAVGDNNGRLYLVDILKELKPNQNYALKSVVAEEMTPSDTLTISPINSIMSSYSYNPSNTTSLMVAASGSIEVFNVKHSSLLGKYSGYGACKKMTFLDDKCSSIGCIFPRNHQIMNFDFSKDSGTFQFSREGKLPHGIYRELYGKSVVVGYQNEVITYDPRSKSNHYVTASLPRAGQICSFHRVDHTTLVCMNTVGDLYCLDTRKMKKSKSSAQEYLWKKKEILSFGISGQRRAILGSSAKHHNTQIFTVSGRSLKLLDPQTGKIFHQMFEKSAIQSCFYFSNSSFLDMTLTRDQSLMINKEMKYMLEQVSQDASIFDKKNDMLQRLNSIGFELGYGWASEMGYREIISEKLSDIMRRTISPKLYDSDSMSLYQSIIFTKLQKSHHSKISKLSSVLSSIVHESIKLEDIKAKKSLTTKEFKQVQEIYERNQNELDRLKRQVCDALPKYSEELRNFPMFRASLIFKQSTKANLYFIGVGSNSNSSSESKLEGYGFIFAKKRSTLFTSYRKVYEGTFKAGQKNGKGIEFSEQSGQVLYSGEFVNGKREGSGMMVETKFLGMGNVITAGIFRDGKLVKTEYSKNERSLSVETSRKLTRYLEMNDCSSKKSRKVVILTNTKSGREFNLFSSKSGYWEGKVDVGWTGQSRTSRNVQIGHNRMVFGDRNGLNLIDISEQLDSTKRKVEDEKMETEIEEEGEEMDGEKEEMEELSTLPKFDVIFEKTSASQMIPTLVGSYAVDYTLPQPSFLCISNPVYYFHEEKMRHTFTSPSFERNYPRDGCFINPTCTNFGITMYGSPVLKLFDISKGKQYLELSVRKGDDVTSVFPIFPKKIMIGATSRSELVVFDPLQKSTNVVKLFDANQRRVPTINTLCGVGDHYLILGNFQGQLRCRDIRKLDSPDLVWKVHTSPQTSVVTSVYPSPISKHLFSSVSGRFVDLRDMRTGSLQKRMIEKGDVQSAIFFTVDIEKKDTLRVLPHLRTLQKIQNKMEESKSKKEAVMNVMKKSRPILDQIAYDFGWDAKYSELLTMRRGTFNNSNRILEGIHDQLIVDNFLSIIIEYVRVTGIRKLEESIKKIFRENVLRDRTILSSQKVSSKQFQLICQRIESINLEHVELVRQDLPKYFPFRTAEVLAMFPKLEVISPFSIDKPSSISSTISSSSSSSSIKSIKHIKTPTSLNSTTQTYAFIGLTINGVPHGHGFLYTVKGGFVSISHYQKVYEGNFVGGLKDGKGTEFDDHGFIAFEGLFHNGERHGHGDLYDNETGFCRSGVWEHGRMVMEKSKEYNFVTVPYDSISATFLKKQRSWN